MTIKFNARSANEQNTPWSVYSVYVLILFHRGLNTIMKLLTLWFCYLQEAQKLALAELTGLDQKQINNWFINQRKRHWKPSEDMQFVVMDAAHPHYLMDNIFGNYPFPMDVSLL